MQVSDYYAVLGVHPRADLHEIKSAYRHLVRRYHPDVAKRKHAARRFLLIREAYEVLSDPEKRRQYDRLIASPSLASRRSRRQPTTTSRPATSGVESSPRHRGFRLVLDALGIFRLVAGIDVGTTPSRTRPQRQRGIRVNRTRK